jgi:hypothetical protein
LIIGHRSVPLKIHPSYDYLRNGGRSGRRIFATGND